jgi:hypothetical protein
MANSPQYPEIDYYEFAQMVGRIEAASADYSLLQQDNR